MNLSLLGKVSAKLMFRKHKNAMTKVQRRYQAVQVNSFDFFLFQDAF